jgi:adenosylmethionine-8-amino-7-oxononanoate aminotransferase
MKIWRPYTQMHMAAEQERVSHTEGSFIHLKNGKKIFDGISSWWLITHGHCHPEIADAVSSQSKKVDQVVFANFIHEPAESLVEELGKILPEKLNSIFFSDNGSTAVEVAMKMAYQYCRLKGDISKNKFCAFDKSYHGDTFGAMSINADGVFTKSYSDLRIDVIRCKQGTRSTDELNVWLDDFSLKISERHREIIAVILEPVVQGAGGMIAWPTEAVNRICSLCREYDVLLIFDEVMTGFGRTGKMFAFEHLQAIPDFVCLSKGLTGGMLPLALTLTSAEVYNAFLSEDSSKMFFHGHSFTANPISCAAACANLKIFRKDDTLRKIAGLEYTHKKSIEKVSQRLQLKDSRVVGTIGAIELSRDFEYGSEFSKKLYAKCLDAGLFLRPLGSTVYLMPPYGSSSDELEWAWSLVGEAIEKCQVSPPASQCW